MLSDDDFGPKVWCAALPAAVINVFGRYTYLSETALTTHQPLNVSRDIIIKLRSNPNYY